eukprot:TRINITY_DN57639_c0_g1_i1.p2 TRINITY_DN57639_c0_g1~~TRINITY_DN57639_c0_g1_i1.p2  ORF type:complete len:164 (+),score=28.93 TRINITY_DN57639_c0_g1_i1:83-574(+)
MCALAISCVLLLALHALPTGVGAITVRVYRNCQQASQQKSLFALNQTVLPACAAQPTAELRFSTGPASNLNPIVVLKPKTTFLGVGVECSGVMLSLYLRQADCPTGDAYGFVTFPYAEPGQCAPTSTNLYDYDAGEWAFNVSYSYELDHASEVEAANRRSAAC